MTILMDGFGSWLIAEIDKRDISQSKLARMSGLSEGTISNIISGRRGRGTDSLDAIARALKLPKAMMYQKAGLLPPDKETSDEIKQIVHELEGMTEEEQREFLSYIRWRNNQKKK